MAIAPFAEWRGPLPLSNYAPGQMDRIIGVTVHHMDGSLASADGWFHNSRAGSSAHFGIGYDGHIVQWVDTADVSYHACMANWGWVGIENESDPNQPDAPPTAQQIAAMGQIIAWLGTPAVPATSMNSGGVGYHRQFGGPCNQAWGQTACPGQGFIDAIAAICAAAGGTAPAPTDEHKESDTVLYGTKDGKWYLKWGYSVSETTPGDAYVHAISGVPVVRDLDPLNIVALCVQGAKARKNSDFWAQKV